MTSRHLKLTSILLPGGGIEQATTCGVDYNRPLKSVSLFSAIHQSPYLRYLKFLKPSRIYRALCVCCAPLYAVIITNLSCGANIMLAGLLWSGGALVLLVCPTAPQSPAGIRGCSPPSTTNHRKAVKGSL